MNITPCEPGKKRVVIVGGGFAGLTLARRLVKDKSFQVVMVDKDNYHEFPPLIYQVATAGLEPTAVSYPLRKSFRKYHDFHFRMAKVLRIDAQKREVHTSVGPLAYDYLVLAAGTGTNYFGMKDIQANAMPLKSVAEALALRNRILEMLEHAVRLESAERRKPYLTFVISGGGPTGVELAGAMAELRNKIFPKDYPELDMKEMKIYLLDAGPRLLTAFSEESSARALKDLQEYGIEVLLDTPVKAYDGKTVRHGGGQIESYTLVWASGVTATVIEGIGTGMLGHANRILVDGINRVSGVEHVFAIGDICLQSDDPKYPKGHPQLAPVAIQQAHQLAKNLSRLVRNERTEPFRYLDKGTMATIGRNQAVAEIKGRKFGGFVAWALWLFVHLMYLVGFRNRMVVMFGWAWSYFTYDHPLRSILEAEKKECYFDNNPIAGKEKSDTFGATEDNKPINH